MQGTPIIAKAHFKFSLDQLFITPEALGSMAAQKWWASKTHDGISESGDRHSQLSHFMRTLRHVNQSACSSRITSSSRQDSHCTRRPSLNESNADDRRSQLKFPLGQLVATPAALESLQKAGQSATEFLQRHVKGDWGDWGDLCNEDRQANDQSLIGGCRLLSAYRTSLREKLWVITEPADECGNRAATTSLLPSEY